MADDQPANAVLPSGAAKILEAAVRQLGHKGIAATSLKSIAAEADVSQALIIHHFGSKDGLRRACDAHVLRLIRERKEVAIDSPQLDPLQGLRMMADGRHLMRYLVRALTEGGHGVDDLVDGMVADAEAYMARGVEAGTLRPSAVPRERVVLLTVWSLGALVLHEHIERLLGVDFLAEDYGPAGLAPYLRPAMELFTQGLMEEGVYEQFARSFDEARPSTDPGEAPEPTADPDPNLDPKD